MKSAVKYLLFTALTVLLFSGCEDDGFVSDYARGIKDALTEGIKRSVDKAGAENGYYESALKILLPDEGQSVINTINGNSSIKTVMNSIVLPYVGYKSSDGNNNIAGFEKDIVLSMNRAAERAAGFETTTGRSDPITGTFDIFADAITALSISDAVEILKGNVPGTTREDTAAAPRPDAATQYLKNQTYESLKTLFKKIIDTVLDEKIITVGSVQYSVNEVWKYFYDAVSYYNSVRSSTAVILLVGSSVPTLTTPPASLSDHVTTKALDGLFSLIAGAEGEIRANPTFAGASEFLVDAFEYARDTLGAVF